MWISKITFDCKNALLGEKSLKHNISVAGYPLSFSQEGNNMVVNVAGTIFGKDSNKKAFFEELKKSPRVIDLESNGDFLMGTIKEPLISTEFYNKDIFHLAPIIISEGSETITIGSFKKEILVKAIGVFEKLHQAKISYIRNKKVKTISIIKENPDLTDKQKEAMTLAIKEGYYDYPRRIDVQDLALKSKLSFSTFHAHLRKAEQKLIPFFFNN